MTNPYSVDYSADYNYVDGIETISLTPQNPAATAITGIKAVRSTVNLSEVQQYGSIGTNTGDVLFVIYLATTTTAPLDEDLITDAAGVKYIVQSVRMLADEGQARTVCKQVQA